MPGVKRADKGSYLLGISLAQVLDLFVGRLGQFAFSAGYYIYAGSAQGPGGLAARLNRHRRREKQLHWHIDYLLAHACLTDVWSIVSKERLECLWARGVAEMPGARIVAPRFGASDCRCPAHLIHFSQPPRPAQVRKVLQARTKEKALVEYNREIENDSEHWIQVLLEGDQDTREGAALALGAIGEAAVPHLLALQNNADIDIRCWAAWALAKTGSEQAIRPLISALKDTDSDMRLCAVMALGELRAAEASPALVAQLQIDDGLLTRCAADALEKIGAPAIPALMGALEHPKNQVRVWATRALGRIGSTDTVKALCRVYLYDASYLAQYYAEEALRKMGLLEIILLE